MKYNFNEIIARGGTNSYKWDTTTDVLPMWVADMDFHTAPSVVEALHRRVAHGIFGYTKVPQTYYDTVVHWFNKRHNWLINSDWIIYTTGVVPAISAIIKALTVPGDRVLVQTPVYNCFFSSICNNGCEMVDNPLIYSNGAYSIDFADLEQKVADSRVKLLLLCNPHNPVGRVWTLKELTIIGEICLRNNVIVVADEIHCDLIYSGHRYVPFASISEEFLMNSVTCTSPSKAFNLAGLQIANIFSADANVRAKIDKAININEVCDVNSFGVEALMAAYNYGDEWLNELNEYLYGNYNYLKDYFNDYLPEFTVLPLEGTYLVWVDCSVLKCGSKAIEKHLLENEKLWINRGIIYGDESTNSFIRINIACPRQMLMEGLVRLKKGMLYLANSSHSKYIANV